MRVGVQVVVVTPQQVQLRHARARIGERDISCGRRGCGWRRWSRWWVTLSNRVLESDICCPRDGSWRESVDAIC